MNTIDKYLKSEKRGITRLYASNQLNILQERLDWFGNKDVLDIGCGKGVLEAMFSHLTNSFVSCDIVDYNIFDLDIKICSAAELIFEPNSFDTIFMLGIVEHLKDNERVLCVSECYNKLRKGGKLIISIPNGLFWIISRKIKYLLPENLKIHSLFGQKELYELMGGWKLIKKYTVLSLFFTLYEFQKI